MARGLRGRNDPPVTLFAFQDVMTAIIGILLFVVLLMAVQTSAVANAVGEQADAGDLTEQVEELERRRSTAIKALDTQAMIAERARQSEGMQGIVRDRAQLASLYSEIERIEREITNRFDEIKRKAADSSTSESTISVMIAAQQEHERLQGELELSKLNKRLTYIVSKHYGRRPILIEVSSSVWRVSADANGDTMISLTENPPSDRIDSLDSVLENFDTDDFYCLLIVKPSASEDVEEIRGAILRRGFTIGLDAIPEDFTGMIDAAGITP